MGNATYTINYAKPGPDRGTTPTVVVRERAKDRSLDLWLFNRRSRDYASGFDGGGSQAAT